MNNKTNNKNMITESLLLSPSDDIKGFIIAKLGKFFLFGTTCSSVIAVLFIFYFVIQEAWPFIYSEGKSHFLTLITSTEWFPQDTNNPRFGGVAIITGSIYVTVISLAISVPIGLLSAIFLSDIASFKAKNYIKPIIEILAAIPSVAYGFFAVIILAPWLQKHLGIPTGTNAINASLILAIMALPTIISVAEDTLSAVPRQLREASYGLGANRFETMIKVIIPAGHSGIITAVILGMMRAIGETMVVWMASGNANQVPSPWWDITQSVRTMTATIAGELGETPKDTTHYYSLFGIGLLLLIITFTLNGLCEIMMTRSKRKMEGK